MIKFAIAFTSTELSVLKGATGHGVEPSTPEDFALLDQVIQKIENAQEALDKIESINKPATARKRKSA